MYIDRTTITIHGYPVANNSQKTVKADLFEALHHLNRGYGVALAAFDRLEVRDRQHAPRAFPAGFLHDYRNRTEALRAIANRDLLRLLAGREEHEAERFVRKTQTQIPSLLIAAATASGVEYPILSRFLRKDGDFLAPER